MTINNSLAHSSFALCLMKNQRHSKVKKRGGETVCVNLSLFGYFHLFYKKRVAFSKYFQVLPLSPPLSSLQKKDQRRVIINTLMRLLIKSETTSDIIELFTFVAAIRTQPFQFVFTCG